MKFFGTNKFWCWLLLVSLIGLSGCATTTDLRDPMEGLNRKVQSFNDGLDKYVMSPVAKGYIWITPDFARIGLGNFFNNIDDIRVVFNDLLQFKFKQGGKNSVRFLLNSVGGLGGFFDVATMMEIYKDNEDLGQTLGYWGVPTGPYMVWPIFGPHTLRSTFGLVGKVATNPLTYIGVPAASFGAGTVNLIHLRSVNLVATKIAEEAALDRYEFLRNAYLQQRESLVHDGEIADDYFDE